MPLFSTVNTPIYVDALGFYDGEGNFFHSITPILLSAGNEYVVVAFTNGNDWSYSLTSPPIVTDSSSITFEGTGYAYTASLQYPTPMSDKISKIKSALI